MLTGQNNLAGLKSSPFFVNNIFKSIFLFENCCARWFILYWPGQDVEQTVEVPVIWDTMELMLCHCNGTSPLLMQRTAHPQTKPIFHGIYCMHFLHWPIVPCIHISMGYYCCSLDHTLSILYTLRAEQTVPLTRYGLVTPYGNIDLGPN